MHTRRIWYSFQSMLSFNF